MDDQEDAAARRERLRAAAERRLDAGEWLRLGEVGALFGTDRWAAAYWLRKGVRIGGERFYIGYRTTPGKWRECDPADVRRVLDANSRRQTGGRPQDETDPPPAD